MRGKSKIRKFFCISLLAAGLLQTGTAEGAVDRTKQAYENIAISQVSNYVNVRDGASTAGSIVGKLYNNCAATILATVDGEGGKWYQIQSGSVQGYIKAEYFITGAQAEAAARKAGVSFARVANTSTLRLREKADLSSRTLELLSPEAEYEVVGEEGNFAKIAVDTDLVGYVSMDYIDIRVEFDTAVSLAEEAARTAETARLKSEADSAIKQLEAVKREDSRNQATAVQPEPPAAGAVPETGSAGSGFTGVIEANPAGMTNPSEPTKAPEETKASGETKAPAAGNPAAPGTGKVPETAEAAPGKAPGTSGSKGNTGSGGAIGPGGGASTQVVTAARTAVVAYARQFLGNPYVYGGTSLTNGADCSGFTQGVFAHFGITTGRSSRDQAVKGREIAVGSVKPGDLLFYGSDNYINHVALYIGDGKIIHASTSQTGIIISPANYRTPCKAVSFLD